MAASMTMVPLLPRLVFLVVGPAVDVKLFAMQAGMFGRAFAARFAPATFLVAKRRARALSGWWSRWWINEPGKPRTPFCSAGHQPRHDHGIGRLTRYVKPGLLPWLAASAVLLIALAIVAIIGDIRRDGARRRRSRPRAHPSGRHRVAARRPGPGPDLRDATGAAALGRRPLGEHGLEYVLNQAFPPLPPGDARRVAAGGADPSGSRQHRLVDESIDHGDRLCPQRGSGRGPWSHRHHLLRRRRSAGPHPCAWSGRRQRRRTTGQHLASGRGPSHIRCAGNRIRAVFRHCRPPRSLASMPRPTPTPTLIDESIGSAEAASPKLMPAELAWHWRVFPIGRARATRAAPPPRRCR